MKNEIQTTTKGAARVLQLEEGNSYWQPVPANGFVRCLLNSSDVNSEAPFTVGTQTVDVGGHVRTHSHDKHEEIIFFLSGSGRIEIDDSEEVYDAQHGTTVFLGKNRRHSFINTGSEPLTFLWILMPSGIEEFFSMIGKKRDHNEPQPEPFPRPENIEQIEAETVFASSPSNT